MKDIILLGPVAVGKSTTARLISEKINKPVVSLDDLRLGYYKEIGYDHDHMKELREKAGIMAIFQYGKIFDAYSIERILEDHQNCIFDFGGGNIVSGYDFDLIRIKKALESYENVVFLVPAKDNEETLKFIYERRDIKLSDRVLIEYIVNSHSNYEVAKHTVFVKDKTPEEVCDEIVSICNLEVENRIIAFMCHKFKVNVMVSY
jgi:shikimate kinase